MGCNNVSSLKGNRKHGYMDRGSGTLLSTESQNVFFYINLHNRVQKKFQHLKEGPREYVNAIKGS